MSNEYFDKVADKIGFDNLNVEIVDSKFIITPSDAGLLIFAHLDIAEKQLVEAEKEVLALHNELDEMRDDNSQIRDLLDRCYGVLVEVGQHGLAEEVLAAAYPAKGIQERELTPIEGCQCGCNPNVDDFCCDECECQ